MLSSEDHAEIQATTTTDLAMALDSLWVRVDCYYENGHRAPHTEAYIDAIETELEKRACS